MQKLGGHPLVPQSSDNVEYLPIGAKTDDEWEDYIRESDPGKAIPEYGRRWLEFYQECRTEHSKQGGSRFREFVERRFGKSAAWASKWVAIGKEADLLFSITKKFDADWDAYYQFTTLPEEKRQALLEGPEKISQRLVKASKTKAKRKERLDEIGEAADLEGVYSVIYADPPWRYEHVKTENRAIENQYPTMSLQEICDLDVPSAEDCILFLWTTAPKLEEAFVVLSAWGFTYRTCAVWDKEKMGMGYYFRVQHELLLVATCGNMPVPDESARPASVVHEKRGKHSAKPDLFYRIIEGMYPGMSRLEMFSRRKRKGWDRWGNQANA